MCLYKQKTGTDADFLELNLKRRGSAVVIFSRQGQNNEAYESAFKRLVVLKTSMKVIPTVLELKTTTNPFKNRWF